MPSLFVIGHLKTSGGEARQKVVEALTKVSKYSEAQEPGVLKFCIAVPREGDDKSVFAIEEYEDQAAMDGHMASAAVAELIKTFGSDESLFANEPAIYGLPSKLSTGASFTQPTLSKIPDPFIIFANFGYKEGMASQAANGWDELVGSVQNTEEGTLTYTILEDKEKSFIRTVEAYDSLEFLQRTHMKSPALAANQKQNGEMRTGEKEVYRLRMVAGYLYKETLKACL